MTIDEKQQFELARSIIKSIVEMQSVLATVLEITAPAPKGMQRAQYVLYAHDVNEAYRKLIFNQENGTIS